jgi:aminoglycoside phosphotransferase
MDIKNILQELVSNGIIDSETTSYKRLSGGTVSELFLLDSSQMVIKINKPEIVKSEADFLQFYSGLKLLPKLIFVESSYKYLVYTFISGTTEYPKKKKKEILRQLVQGLINHYKIVPNPIGWGWADDTTESWESFLLNEVKLAYQTIEHFIEKEEFKFVVELVKSRNRKRKDQYLLHGDCGIHNFIFSDQKLIAVIDPTSVIGDPLYDLIYAFCSSPDDLTIETLQPAVNLLLKKDANMIENLHEAVIIGLFLRLSSCIKHHPHEFEEYLQAWDYWKNIKKIGDMNNV